MQEDLEQRTVSVSIQAAKLSGRVLRAAIAAVLQKMEQERTMPKVGRNSMKRLTYKDPGANTIEVSGRIRSFERYARKHQVRYPYVWGGASPSTSFDCSGYVSWAINNCGVGWNFGRLTADGLLGVCTPVSSADAKPGDLIFFQGTYNTSGASHVGIYVGNGMMIHCGDPISYANINTSYWQQHFYTFGRLP